MSYKLLGGGSDLSTIVNDMNQNILEMKGREVTEIFKDDTGTRRVLLGKGPNGFYGLLVSKPGIDVFEATADQLAFTSGQNVFKIVDTGTLTLHHPANTTTVQVSVAHGLSHIPIAIMFLADTDDTQRYSIPFTSINTSTGTVAAHAQTFMDATDVGVNYYTPNTVGNSLYGDEYSQSVKYYLLQETAN